MAQSQMCVAAPIGRNDNDGRRDEAVKILNFVVPKTLFLSMTKINNLALKDEVC